MLLQPRLGMPLLPFTFNRPNASYLGRILATSPIACWSLSDLTGTVAVNAEGTSARDGTYTNGVTLNSTTFTDGTPAPSFDGTDDLINIYSSSLNSAINFNEGAMMFWMKMDATLLASATQALLASFSDTAIANGLRPQKTTSANSFIFRRKFITTNEDINVTISSSGWVNVFYNYSNSANKSEAFVGGVSQGSTTCGNIISASLDNARTLIGASTTSAQVPFKGNIKYFTLWPAAQSSTVIGSLSTV